jgi:RNA polymerase sigma-70 factor, ECF subfamily
MRGPRRSAAVLLTAGTIAVRPLTVARGAAVRRVATATSLGSVSQEVPDASTSRSRRLAPARLPEHTERLYRAAYALCGSSADAEDLVQETFARVLSRPRFVRRGGERAYLMRVLRNIWIDFARARAVRPEAVGGEVIDWVTEDGSDPGELVLDVRLAYEGIRELPEHQREAIAAVDVLGLSYKEAARALSIRQGTLMSRLARARDRVAAHMEGTA